MDEETLRQMAITQYLQGKKPISIYRDLGKTKKWFFKWLKRYRSGDEHWYRDLSRAPLSQPHQTSSDTRKLILSIRNDLDSSYAQIGVTAIRWEGQKLGISLPSDSTINRILKREDLVKKNSLSPERGRVSLLPRIPGHQLHSPGRSHRTQVYQERRSILFLKYHRPGQPSGFYTPPTPERRYLCSLSFDSLLENHGRTGFPPTRQRIELSGQQSASSVSGDCLAALPANGDRSSFYPRRRTLAQCRSGKLQ
jgi:Homeodomain-like domain